MSLEIIHNSLHGTDSIYYYASVIDILDKYYSVNSTNYEKESLSKQYVDIVTKRCIKIKNICCDNEMVHDENYDVCDCCGNEEESNINDFYKIPTYKAENHVNSLLRNIDIKYDDKRRLLTMFRKITYIYPQHMKTRKSVCSKYLVIKLLNMLNVKHNMSHIKNKKIISTYDKAFTNICKHYGWNNNI